jgi:hypothetical protein
MNEPIHENRTLDAPGSILGVLSELLRSPDRSTERIGAGAPARPFVRLTVGALLMVVAYGAVAGFFQGGQQVMVAALKAPLIVFGTLLLCLPSLFVFTSLAGAGRSPRQILMAAAGFSSMTGLLLVALLPIAWLFSVSSRSLLFVTWLHFFVWICALYFGLRYLRTAIPVPDERGVLVLWWLLFCVVSCQMTTFVQPVLWRAPGSPLFKQEKIFFTEQVGNVSEHDRTAKDTKGEESRAPVPR